MSFNGDTNTMRLPHLSAQSRSDRNAVSRLRAEGGTQKEIVGWRPAVFVGPNNHGVRLSGDRTRSVRRPRERTSARDVDPEVAERRSRRRERAAQHHAMQVQTQDGTRRDTRGASRSRTHRRSSPSFSEIASQHKGLVALIIAALVALSLYGPLQGWYVAQRRNQDLQAQLDALSASNEDLQADVEDLQSEEGIEDEARRRGYVQEGETPVAIEGSQGQDASDNSVQDNSLADGQATRAQTNIGTDILDFIFQYHFQE